MQMREDRRQDERWMSRSYVRSFEEKGLNPSCASEGRRKRRLVSVTAQCCWLFRSTVILKNSKWIQKIYSAGLFCAFLPFIIIFRAFS